MDGWMDEWINGWMGGWVDGWMDGWMDDGWMDGWMKQGRICLLLCPETDKIVTNLSRSVLHQIVEPEANVLIDMILPSRSQILSYPRFRASACTHMCYP